MAKKAKAMKPRPHQKEAIAGIRKILSKSSRAQVSMACGTGKTLVGIESLEEAKGSRKIVFVPTIGLIYQSLRSYGEQMKFDRTLIVCSDKSEAKEAMDVYSIQNVTTDTDEIAKEIRRRNAGELVIFCTYDSVPKLTECYKQPRLPKLDFAVMDEAHRLAGKESDRKAVLFDDQVPIKKRLFLTATPRVSKGGKSEGEVYSMDDEKLFGKVAYSLPFSEAIKRSLLSDYQVVVIQVSEEEVRKCLDDNQDMAFAAKQVGLLKAMHNHKFRKGLAFYQNNKRAADATETLSGMHDKLRASKQSSGNLWLRQLSHKDNVKAREKALEEMKGKSNRHRCLITNCRIFSEGIDVPVMDCVGIMDPMTSEVDIVQSVGRAIRPHNDKVKATIVVPVFLSKKQEEEGGAEVSTMRGPYKAVFGVLRALKDHDDRFEAAINPTQQRGDGEDDKKPNKGNAGLPENIVFEGLDESVIGDIRTKVVSLAPVTYTEDYIWEKMCEQAEMNGGKFPSQRDAVLVDGLHWNRWNGVEDALRRGCFGLGGEVTLKGIRESKVTSEGILERAAEVEKQTGLKVNAKSPGVAICGFGWQKIQSMLASGKVGGATSLSGLLGSRRCKRLSKDYVMDQYTEFMKSNLRRPTKSDCLPDGGGKFGSLYAFVRKNGIAAAILAKEEEVIGFQRASWTEEAFEKAVSQLAFRPSGRTRLACGRTVSSAQSALGHGCVASIIDSKFGASEMTVEFLQGRNRLFMEMLVRSGVDDPRAVEILKAGGNMSNACGGFKKSSLNTYVIACRKKFPGIWAKAQAEAAKQGAPKKQKPPKKSSH